VTHTSGFTGIQPWVAHYIQNVYWVIFKYSFNNLFSIERDAVKMTAQAGTWENNYACSERCHYVMQTENTIKTPVMIVSHQLRTWTGNIPNATSTDKTCQINVLLLSHGTGTNVSQKTKLDIKTIHPLSIYSPYFNKVQGHWDRIPVGMRFSTRPDRPWGPPSLL